MRTRKNRKGGVGFGDISSFFTGKKDVPEAVPVTVAQPIEGTQNLKEAIVSDANIDAEVKKLTQEPGYHMRAIINAIGICNSTMKMRSNAMNPLKSEMFICGDECKKRAESVKVALKTLTEYAERSPALGYIASGGVGMNSLNYVSNSAASLGNKAMTGIANAPGALRTAPAAIKQSLSNAPTALSNAATTARTNITQSVNAVGNYFKTRKGGRRRRR